MTDSLWNPEVPRKYGDILDVEWQGVRSHNRANSLSRAAQFSPFAALVGFDDEISETARLTMDRIELSDEKREEIEIALQAVITGKQEADFTYFVEDSMKSGGSYETARGRVVKFKEFEKIICLEDGIFIPVSDIVDIEIL